MYGQPNYGQPQPGYPLQQAYGYPPQQPSYPSQHASGSPTQFSPMFNLAPGMAINVQFNNGHFLRAQPNGTFDDGADRPAEWERFTLEPAGSNLYALRTAHGKIVCWDQGQHRLDVRDAVGDWERFEIRPAGPGKFHLYSPAHRVFIHGGGGIRSAPHPELITVYGAPQAFIQPGNYFIRNHHGRYIDVEQSRITQSPFANHHTRVILQAIPGRPNCFGIRSAVTNKVVCFDSSGRIETRDNIGGWETVEIQPVANRPGKFTIYCPEQRKFLRCDSNFTAAPDQSNQAGEWEQYELLPA